MFKRLLKTVTGGNSREEWAFLDAAESGNLNIDTIDKALKVGFDINCMVIKKPLGYEGYTPLMHYVGSYKADADVTEYLLRNGADPRVSSKYGHTALSHTIYGNKDSKERGKIIQLLIYSGADPNSKDSSGYTPLHNFCSGGETEEISFLLNHGAMKSINLCGKIIKQNPYWGFSPLHYTIYETRRARTSRLPIAKLLINRGADVNLRCNSIRRFTPMELIRDNLLGADSAARRAAQGDGDLEWARTWKSELERIREYLIASGAKSD